MADTDHGRRTAERERVSTLPGEGRAPALEWIEAGPAGPSSGPPLLLVHGAFGGAWQWREVFMPLLARRGYRTHAFSFRGHGASEGRRELRSVSFGDYVDDLARAIARVGEPPVVIAHSLGGLVAQRLLGSAPMRGLVLLASLPPDGLAFVGPRLALTEPAIWGEAFVGSVAKARGPVTMAAGQVLFSDGLDPVRAMNYAARMTPESPRALLDAHAPGPIAPAWFAGVPALVLGGGRDRLVWRPSVWRTALYHGAPQEVIESMGHFLQLDPGADGVARRILAWLDGRGLG